MNPKLKGLKPSATYNYTNEKSKQEKFEDDQSWIKSKYTWYDPLGSGELLAVIRERDAKAIDAVYENQGFEDSKAGLGVIYLRLDNTGKVLPYVGRAKNWERYLKRQAEHARKYPDSDFSFSILMRGKHEGRHPTPLTRKEQKMIDKYKKKGPVSNIKNAYNKKKYGDLDDK